MPTHTPADVGFNTTKTGHLRVTTTKNEIRRIAYALKDVDNQTPKAHAQRVLNE